VTARRQTPKRSKAAAPAEGSSSTSSGRRKRQSPAGRAKKTQPKPRATTPSPTALIDDLKLTERQKRFVFEYHVSGNGSEAARRAGYATKHANEQAAENLTKPNIVEALRRLNVQRYERLGQDADRTRLEIARLANASMGKICSWERGKLKLADSADLSPEDLAAIAEVGYDSKGRLKVKLFDKCRALEMQAKANRLYADDDGTPPPPTQSTDVTVNILLGLSPEQRAARLAELLAKRDEPS
jgi:phage terminase small subunit